jgi:Lon protease-like protein
LSGDIGLVELPLFPLNAVLFPGGPLALRIFEPRYLSMVSQCMRGQHGFGVVLIEEGSEAGAAKFATTGTRAEIVDWNRGRDGLLALVAEGHERFTVLQSHRQADGLYVGRISPLPPERAVPVPERYRRLSHLLAKLLEADEVMTYDDLAMRLSDATWVGFRLAELLPLAMPTKQSLLEATDAIGRLELLMSHADNVETFVQ